MTIYYKDYSGALFPNPDRDKWLSEANYVEIDDSAIKPYTPPKFKVGDRIRLKCKPSHTGLVRAVEPHLYCIDWPTHPGVRKMTNITMIDRDYELAPTLEDVISAHWQGARASIGHLTNGAERIITDRSLAAAIREAFPEADL